MTLLTEAERLEAAREVRAIIEESSQHGVLLRAVPGEKLYGSDEQTFAEIGTFPFEFVWTPPTELAQKIDATACVLPELDVRAEDRIRIDTVEFRVQSAAEERLFGVVTHKVL